MKRCVDRLISGSTGSEDYMKEVPEIDEFLKQIDAVCKQHNMSISHEDFQGGFRIEEYDVTNITWLSHASDARGEK